MRECRRLSRPELAKLAGIDRALVWQFEDGRRTPSLEQVLLLAKGLETDPRALIPPEGAEVVARYASGEAATESRPRAGDASAGQPAEAPAGDPAASGARRRQGGRR